MGGGDRRCECRLRATEQCWARCAEGDYEAATDLLDPSFVHDDRRRGLRNRITGPDDTIGLNRVTVELGMTPEFEPLLVHGGDLALARAMFRDRDGNEVVALQVLTTNAQGLRTCCVSFDADDLEGATHEFEARGGTGG